MWYKLTDGFTIKRLEFNFLPSWWNREYGVTFGEPMVFDADYRIETQRFMDRTVNQRFPEIGMGSPEPEPQMLLPSLGNAAIAAAAGCEVEYPDDNYPWNRHLDPDGLRALKAPADLSQLFPYSEIERQGDYLRRRYDRPVEALWPMGGILNNALLIAGDDLLGDLLVEEGAARLFLDYSYALTERAICHNNEVYGWQGLLFVGNCTVMMVSPETYCDTLLPYDLALHETMERIGGEYEIHHCGVLGRHGEAYRRLPRIDFLEIGWESDISQALATFPEAWVQYIFSAVFLKEHSAVEVGSRVDEILDAVGSEGRRFSLLVPDIEYGTPDENVYAVWEACRRPRA